jgi:hypothetical protein
MFFFFPKAHLKKTGQEERKKMVLDTDLDGWLGSSFRFLLGTIYVFLKSG